MKRLFTLLTAALYVACVLANEQDLRRITDKQYYSLGFVNKTGHDLVAVSANYGKEEVASPGRLVKSGRATEGPVPLPIPPEAEVRWDENGAHHAVKAKLEGIVPKGFTRGTIYFVLKADGTVVVKAIKREDIDANAHVGD